VEALAVIERSAVNPEDLQTNLAVADECGNAGIEFSNLLIAQKLT